ncbi:TetR/AcrR family transcriptional regulator [Ruegeria sp. Ofav3-42]|uniref:TetR/AcrR family transcriptional regulator n=1 Tax=Ruegeria sp. Ofav3-42 TaxID=2917759 RepID=UPI001EF6F66D|nr:TetR/AcrR family transcriptional regulator [Ruegeria sp. Ofav3-42]
MPDTPVPSVTPRKAAQQLRSQKKVQTILDTTLTMLTEGPADQITTNAIAARAKISIGSLYQFFPNKEAIFYELFKRWLFQTLNALDEAGQALEDGLSKEECIDAILEALAGHPEINSRGHWQLRRAMGSSRELAELEAQHLQQILQRIIGLHAKISSQPPAELGQELALLQNQVTIACLQVLAMTDESANRARILGWCKKMLLLAFDFPELDRK